MNTEEKGLVSASIVRPLVSIDEAVKAFNEYQKLKTKLRGPGDFARFKDRDGNEKEAPTKQWRAKITRFFGINCEMILEEREDLPDGTFVIKVRYRAIAPNGMSMEGDGSCWSKTKESGKGDLYHNTRSHAHTRAKNRAVLELAGFGEVSAEEIEEDPNGRSIEDINIPKTSNKPDEAMTDAQHNKIQQLIQDKGKTEEDRAAYLATSFKGKVKTTQKGEHYAFEITKKDASVIIGELMKQVGV